MAEPSRLAPCPCGSGRRYRDCHGALDPERMRLQSLLQEALALQEASHPAEAIPRYEEALRIDPNHFDATHMLGVCWFQLNELERAEPIVARAVELAPAIVAAQSNLRLIRDGRDIEAREERLCEQALARLAPLCARGLAPPMPAPGAIVVGTRVLAPAALDVLRRLMAACAGAALWAVPSTRTAAEALGAPRIATPASPLDPACGEALLFGVDVPAAGWLPEVDPPRVTLVVNRPAPCLLFDRVRELSVQGRQPVRVVSLADGDAGKLPSVPFDAWLDALTAKGHVQ